MIYVSNLSSSKINKVITYEQVKRNTNWVDIVIDDLDVNCDIWISIACDRLCNQVKRVWGSIVTYNKRITWFGNENLSTSPLSR